EMESSAPVVHQGELVQVELTVQADSPGGLELQKLKETSVGETIYFYEISPLLKKEGGASPQATARVIFIKVPESNSISGKLNGESLKINLKDIKVEATDTPKVYQFGNFEIPKPSLVIRWILGIIGVLLLSALVGF